MTRAFCITITATYMFVFHCYLPSYIIFYAFLVDFLDFSTKSHSLVFNFCEAENLLFRILCVSVLSVSQKIEEKIIDQFFTRKRIVSKRSTRGEPRGPNGTRWHALHVWARHPGPFTPQALSWPPSIPDHLFRPKI
jgi:hypothetical protein